MDRLTELEDRVQVLEGAVSCVSSKLGGLSEVVSLLRDVVATSKESCEETDSVLAEEISRIRKVMGVVSSDVEKLKWAAGQLHS